MVRRFLHPGAWWLWAGLLATAALRTTNPMLLLPIIAVVAFVVARRRTDAPWASSFGSFLRLGVIVIVVRMVFQMLFGNRLPGHELFTLPEVTLPEWAAGVSIGGPVTAEAMLGAFYEGLRLAAVIACVGAASSLCSPTRLLRALPAALYEAGMAVSVALSFAPQAVVSARQVREARRLRGRADSGVRAWVGAAMPVLEGALERSVDDLGLHRFPPVRARFAAIHDILCANAMRSVSCGQKIDIPNKPVFHRFALGEPLPPRIQVNVDPGGLGLLDQTILLLPVSF